MGRLDEIGIYLFSRLFTSRLNALGVANLPTALTSLRSAADNANKKDWLLNYGAGIFHSLVVYSGFTGRWLNLVKVNAAAGIAKAVMNSIRARRKGELVPDVDTMSQTARSPSPSATNILKDLKNRLFPAKKEEDLNAQADSRKKALDKAKALLAGKRDSTFDDVLWGVFQISMVFFDFGGWQALGHAWLVFLVHVCEETVFNDKLRRNQKIRMFAWLAVTAYVSRKLWSSAR
jgi:hypothetical protein